MPLAAEDVNTTLPPAQKVVVPPAVIVGVEGTALTTIAELLEEPDVQPATVTETVYVPAELTVID